VLLMFKPEPSGRPGKSERADGKEHMFQNNFNDLPAAGRNAGETALYWPIRPSSQVTSDSRLKHQRVTVAASNGLLRRHAGRRTAVNDALDGT
jgi:hypothetical protein